MTIIAMVFSGQGTQKLGMLYDLSKHYTVIKQTFEEASCILGYNLWNLIQYGPIQELNKPWKLQPALLAVAVAIWRVWIYKGGKTPCFLAGHSLGEYAALVCANSLEYSDALALLVERAKLMHNAVPKGNSAMLAIIGLDLKLITKLCSLTSKDGYIVSPINFNSPDQIVITGHKKAVEYVGKECKRYGAVRVISLSVDVPSHCVLMEPVSKKLAKILQPISFNTPKISIVNNVDVKIEYDPQAIRSALVRQLYNPVRWMEIIEFFLHKNVELIIEIGPNNILTNLTKRILSSMNCFSLNDHANFISKIIYK